MIAFSYYLPTSWQTRMSSQSLELCYKITDGRVLGDGGEVCPTPCIEHLFSPFIWEFFGETYFQSNVTKSPLPFPPQRLPLYLRNTLVV